MIRTQVQFTNEQFAVLKSISAAEGISMAELIRRGIEQYLSSRKLSDKQSRTQRAIEAAGRFRSGVKNFSAKHDQYFAEVIS
jgi:hypothetical protein